MESFQALLKGKFGKYRLSRGKNGTEYVVCCPYCDPPDRHFKLYVNPAMGLYYCFRCAAKGPISDLISGFAKAEANFVLPNQPEKLQVVTEMPGELLHLSELEESNPGLRYLRSRGFDPQYLEQYYDVRFCVRGKKFAGGTFDATNTLVFPVFFRDKLVGWQARLLYDPEQLSETECRMYGFIEDDDGDFHRPPKYFTSPGFPKGVVLYNFDLAYRFDTVVLTEGVLDAIRTGLCAVATLGKGVTARQVNVIKSNWDAVILLLDPDAGSEQRELYYRFYPEIRVHGVTIEGYKDPGETPREELWRQIARKVQGDDVEAPVVSWRN